MHRIGAPRAASARPKPDEDRLERTRGTAYGWPVAFMQLDSETPFTAAASWMPYWK